YRALGDAISEIRQIVNDLFDLFGKDESADLAGRKWTVPLCVMLHGLTPEARAAWIARITRVDAREVGDFLYASGAMGRVVALIEAARARLHRIARALPCGGPELAALLGFIDGLVSPIYSPPALDDVEEPVRRAL
ncbi:MAG: hypothetical protein KC636_34920, partial [Myxococcales bacterium]|nr:hypothetical protein [Myxococcales bacterium]